MAINFIELFNKYVKKRPSESFTMMLCDLDICDSKQKDLLKKVLEDSTSCQHWWNYISFLKSIQSFSSKSLSYKKLKACLRW